VLCSGYGWVAGSSGDGGKSKKKLWGCKKKKTGAVSVGGWAAERILNR